MTELEGMVALVAGAAFGIGLAIARDFAWEGVRVTISDIDSERGRAVAGELQGARFQAADLGNADDIQRLVADTTSAEGQVDILVNNAGIQYVAPITEFPEAKWRQIIQLMVTAPFLVPKTLVPSM